MGWLWALRTILVGGDWSHGGGHLNSIQHRSVYLEGFGCLPRIFSLLCLIHLHPFVPHGFVFSILNSLVIQDDVMYS